MNSPLMICFIFVTTIAVAEFYPRRNVKENENEILLKKTHIRQKRAGGNINRGRLENHAEPASRVRARVNNDDKRIRDDDVEKDERSRVDVRGRSNQRKRRSVNVDNHSNPNNAALHATTERKLQTVLNEDDSDDNQGVIHHQNTVKNDHEYQNHSSNASSVQQSTVPPLNTNIDYVSLLAKIQKLHEDSSKESNVGDKAVEEDSKKTRNKRCDIINSYKGCPFVEDRAKRSRNTESNNANEANNYHKFQRSKRNESYAFYMQDRWHDTQKKRSLGRRDKKERSLHGSPLNNSKYFDNDWHDYRESKKKRSLKRGKVVHK